MSQTPNFDNRREERQHTSSNAKGRNHVSNYGLENGILCLNGVRIKRNGYKKASPKGNKANRSVNGYVNHGFWRTCDEVVDPREHDQRKAGCAVETTPRNKKSSPDFHGNRDTLLLPPEEEDWEKEVAEGEHSEDQPYGPEDTVQQVLESLTIHQRVGVDPPIPTCGYLPSARHPRPVPWLHSRVPTQADQFADAE